MTNDVLRWRLDNPAQPWRNSVLGAPDLVPRTGAATPPTVETVSGDPLGTHRAIRVHGGRVHDNAAFSAADGSGTAIGEVASGITVSLYVKLADFQSSNFGGMVQKLLSAVAGDIAIQVNYLNDDSGGWYVGLNAGGTPQFKLGGTLTAATWTHIGFTYDGTTLKLYQGGSLVGGPYTMSPAGAIDYGAHGPWIVGGSYTGFDNINGNVQMVRVQNVVRDAGWWSAPTVDPILESIQISSTTAASLGVAINAQFLATSTYDDGSQADITDTVTWSSSTPSVATLNSDGLLTTIALGSTTISASLAGRTSNSYSVAVTHINNVTKLLTALIRPVQDVENALQQLLTQRAIDLASGLQLDVLGRLVGQARAGLDDDTYRRYVRAKITANNSDGAVSDVLLVARQVLGTDDGTVWIQDVQDASMVVEIHDLPTDAVVANVLFQMLRATVAGGVRFALVTSAQTLANTYRLDVGPGLDQGHIVAVTDNPAG